jgi:hypothetical protein
METGCAYHGGYEHYSIPYINDPGEYTIIRRAIYDAELNNVL